MIGGIIEIALKPLIGNIPSILFGIFLLYFLLKIIYNLPFVNLFLPVKLNGIGIILVDVLMILVVLFLASIYYGVVDRMELTHKVEVTKLKAEVEMMRQVLKAQKIPIPGDFDLFRPETWFK